MKFFKEMNEGFQLLSKDSVNRLYENIRTNARNGGGGGKYKTALQKSGLSESEVKKRLNQKKIDSKDRLTIHIQELWVEQKGKCFYTDIKLNEKYLFSGNQSVLSPSIDRTDSNIGYEVGNIRIVMRGINRFKNITKDEDFIQILKNTAISVVDKYNI